MSWDSYHMHMYSFSQLIRNLPSDGVYLSEIDRVLRPGGYWVLSGPPISWKNSYKGWERKAQELQREQAELEDMARRLCWKKIAERGAIAVWQKPTNHLHCLQRKSKVKDSPPFCQKSDHDAGWLVLISIFIHQSYHFLLVRYKIVLNK